MLSILKVDTNAPGGDRAGGAVWRGAPPMLTSKLLPPQCFSFCGVRSEVAEVPRVFVSARVHALGHLLQHNRILKKTSYFHPILP